MKFRQLLIDMWLALFSISIAFSQINHPPIKVLICATHSYRYSGAFLYRINLYQALTNAGCVPQILLSNDAYIKNMFKQKRYHFYTLQNRKKLTQTLLHICEKEKIEIVHTNNAQELMAAHLVAQRLPIRIVHTIHESLPENLDFLHGTDCIITVNQEHIKKIADAHQTNDFGIRQIAWIPPFIDEEKFVAYTPTTTRSHYFKEAFGLTLEKIPVATVIANTYPCKNHPMILKALALLINQYRCPLHIIFAGQGATQNLKALARKLGVTPYAHFVGFVTDIPSLLYFSDMNLLASTKEAFAMTMLEAAFMKKPLIGSRGTGMEATIKDEQTGLLINPQDAGDIALKLKFYIEHKDIAKNMGTNAFAFVNAYYATTSLIEQILDVYRTTLQFPSSKGTP